MRTYTTVQGDMWDSISKKVYGNERHVKELMEANISYISTLIFSSGVILKVPVISIDKTINSISNTPPWRR